mmetsp:Transcript_16058/g.32636  ORF Transcript_16058/g.32636 Transcript_16058/m.32636 type:complete len:250 (+) Transcript_16058:172-921(+)
MQASTSLYTGVPRGPSASRCGAGAETEILQQALSILRALQQSYRLRDVAESLLRKPAWHLQQCLEHKGAELVLCQGEHAVPASAEEPEREALALRLAAVRERGLQDVAGAAVAGAAPEVGAQRRRDALARLRQVLQHGLHDVVREGVPAEVLGLRQQLLQQGREVLATAGVLHEAAEDAAAEAVARDLGTRAQQLPHHEAGHRRRQRRDDRLDHVVPVLRGRGLQHAAAQLGEQLGHRRAVGHLDGHLH